MRAQVLFLVLFLGCSRLLWAQQFRITPGDTERKHSYLLMRDGSVLRGQVMRQDSTVITVKKPDGDMTFVEADQVSRISATHPHQGAGMANVPAGPALYNVFIFRDGTQVEGKYLRSDSTMITVRKRNGQLTYFEPELLLRVDTVRAGMEANNPALSNDRSFANRFSPWLLTGQTAYNAEKGRFYYRNTLLVLNELQYGITRNWSVGAIVNPFFGGIQPNANAARETVVGATVRFTSKFTFPIGEQFRFGVNATYQPKQRGYYYPLENQWQLQGLMSFGDSQRNATLGYGMQLYTSAYDRNISFITAGVMHKLSRSLTFVSDNTFYLNSLYAGSSANLSVALRIDRRRHAFDFGALSSIQPRYYYAPGLSSATKAYFVPYIGYNLLIGRD